jgi:hypothetical protein
VPGTGVARQVPGEKTVPGTDFSLERWVVLRGSPPIRDLRDRRLLMTAASAALAAGPAAFGYLAFGFFIGLRHR